MIKDGLAASRLHLEIIERADLIGLGITYDMLEEALLEVGGTIEAMAAILIAKLLGKI